jgi:hypothetical protein
MTRPRKARRAPIESPALPLLETPDTHPLIDKFGRRHTIHVLTAWSPRALEAMGVHLINTGPEEEAPSAMR